MWGWNHHSDQGRDRYNSATANLERPLFNPIGAHRAGCWFNPASSHRERGRYHPTGSHWERGRYNHREANRSSVEGPPKPDRHATPSSESSSSANTDTEDEKHVSCFLVWLGLNPECMRMSDNEPNMLAHHESKMGNKAIPIFWYRVQEDAELCSEAQGQCSAAVYAMRDCIDRFHIRLGNILCLASHQGHRQAEKVCGRRKWVHKEWESLCFLSFVFMIFLWVYCFPLGFWFSFGFMSFLWVYAILRFFQVWVYIILMFFRVWVRGYMEWKRRVVLREQGQAGVVAGTPISHHHCHSAWQRT